MNRVQKYFLFVLGFVSSSMVYACQNHEFKSSDTCSDRLNVLHTELKKADDSLKSYPNCHNRVQDLLASRLEQILKECSEK